MRLKVLVVDDSAINRRILSTMLKRVNARVDEVSDGVEAVEAVRRHGYDLVLMDLMMPVMDGLEAARVIRAGEGMSGRPMIIAVSAAVTESMRQASVDAGMDGFFAKPVRYEEILSLVGDCLARKHAAIMTGAKDHDRTLFEQTELLCRIGGDASLAVQLAKEFIMHAEPTMGKVRAALDRGDPRGVGDHLFTLADMLLHFSGPLSTAAMELREEALTDGLSGVPRQFGRLADDINLLSREIDLFVQEER